MPDGRTIEALDTDADYLHIQIRASNGRFAGYAEIYAGNDELSEFAARIEGFPANLEERRSYQFGSPDEKTAGGYCTLTLACFDRTGHVLVDVFVNSKLRVAPESARFSFKTEAASIDQFVLQLHRVEIHRVGSARLASTSSGKKSFSVAVSSYFVRHQIQPKRNAAEEMAMSNARAAHRFRVPEE